MTGATATVHRENSSIVTRPAILDHAKWETTTGADGRLGLRPVKGTWHAHIVRTPGSTDTAVVPLIGCPTCGGLTILTPGEKAAIAVGRMLGKRVPVAHSIDLFGKVSPDVQCMHGRCDFRRTVYLDRWTATGKPLYCIVYTTAPSDKLEFAYAHATNRREAAEHLGRNQAHVIIEVAPAVGFWQDERTGKLSTDLPQAVLR